MIRQAVAIAVFAAVTGASHANSPIQLSHIEANVPDAADFESLMMRALLAYFRSNGLPRVDRVEFKLLRDAPTQTGISFPKYYAWVTVFEGDAEVQQGAVRLAAVEKRRFEITDFVSRSQAHSNTTSLETLFPSQLAPVILQLAR